MNFEKKSAVGWARFDPQSGGDLKRAVSEAVEAVGGFKKFVKAGDVVLLKPNFNTADSFPASTDPEFLKAVVELVYDCGAKLVMIGESSTYTLNTRKVMEKLGIFALQEGDRAARVYNFDEGRFIRKEIPGGKYLKSASIPELLDRADKLILLPCLKTHFQAQFSGSLKLSVGFMKPRERVGLHLRNIQEKIAELNKIIKADLAVMDARKCFISGGPSKGEIREPELILASEDRVALDIEGIGIIRGYEGNSLSGVNPRELPQIRRAAEIGL